MALQPSMKEQTLCAAFTSRFRLTKLTFGKIPILTKCFRATTFQKVLTWQSIKLPRLASASGVSYSRRTSTSCSWSWWVRSGVLLVSVLNDRYSHADNNIGLPLNTALLFSTGYKYLFLFQCHFITCDSSKNCTSFWSLLLFTIVFNLWEMASISFDELPCRTILKQLWVDQTHVFLICTDFPEYHLMESLSKILRYHPISFRIPEHCRYEEW